VDTRQRELWSRLKAFEFDPPGAEQTFAGRLAAECGWSRARAAAVVHEYRRFLLLAASAGHPVTPSEEVDQAWHLHLAYTRSYWEDLCGRVLGAALHHGPTRGGAAEDAKYRDWYERTLESYARVFGAPPPPEVWPEAERRFAPGTRFRHIDTRAHWLVPRAHAATSAAVALVLVAASCAVGSASRSAAPGLLFLAGLGLVLVYVARRATRKDARTNARQKRDTGSTTPGAAACGAALGCGHGGASEARPGHSGCGSHGGDSPGGCGSGSGDAGGGCGGGGCGGGGD